MMPIRLKRAYEKPSDEDGMRILVERLWPRGLRKEDARIDLWLKEVAPSTALRKWYGHVPERWPEFQERYFRELDDRRDPVAELRNHIGRRSVTLVFGARDIERNSAVALKAYLEQNKPS